MLKVGFMKMSKKGEWLLTLAFLLGSALVITVLSI